MKKKIAKQWVEALRSKKYRQTRHKLRAGNGAMCCLGVLCEISKLDKWAPMAGSRNRTYLSENDLLPDAVRKWAGMESAGGYLVGGDCLAELNDGGKTFAELADIIESRWTEL